MNVLSKIQIIISFNSTQDNKVTVGSQNLCIVYVSQLHQNSVLRLVYMIYIPLVVS